MASNSTATIFYTIEKEKGDDDKHPNALRVPFTPPHLTIGDVIDNWPFKVRIQRQALAIDTPSGLALFFVFDCSVEGYWILV